MDTTQPSWSATGKVAFRFFVVYFVLYVLPFPVNYIPVVGGYFWRWNMQFWQTLVPWVAKHVVGINYDLVFPNGSGDTTFNYVQLLIFVFVALFMCIIWSILDRRRSNYGQTFYWSLIGMRYYLGLWMIQYGFQKIFMMQFGPLSDAQVNQIYGDSSPMGLMWIFMGYSQGYNFFIGAGEVLGGLFLFFRKTATAGSLLVIAIMSNVVALDFAYDVPVKLFSSHLLIMAFILASADGKRIFYFLINRTAESTERKFSPYDSWYPKARLVANVLFVAWILVGTSHGVSNKR